MGQVEFTVLIRVGCSPHLTLTCLEWVSAYQHIISFQCSRVPCRKLKLSAERWAEGLQDASLDCVWVEASLWKC